MIIQLVLYFLVLGFLFITVSLVDKSHIVLTLFFDILFLGILFWSYLVLIGNPIPYQYNLQTFKHATISKSVIIEGVVVDETLIYLVVRDKDVLKFISYANTPELLAQLKRMVTETNGKGGEHMDTDNYYIGDTAGHVKEKDGTQAHVEETKPDDGASTEGVENYKTTGTGRDTSHD